MSFIAPPQAAPLLRFRYAADALREPAWELPAFLLTHYNRLCGV
jgi:hypothetical protein